MAQKRKVVVEVLTRVGEEDVCDTYREALAPLADFVEVEAEAGGAHFVELARDADAVITSRGIEINRGDIAQLEKCRVIGACSVGTDMIDVDAATEYGIIVVNVPDTFVEEVADHAMMLLLAAARRVKRMNRLAAEGRWGEGRPELNEVPRLWGQTLGLVSFGNVARALARRAGAFGFHIIAHDPYVSELKLTAEGVEPVSLPELLERADYLSLHVPLGEETHHLLSTPEFQAMKKSAVLINTGRGPSIDEAALIKALRTGEIAAAGLDVLETEPPDIDNPLLTMENVVVTPHVASATTRMLPTALRRVGLELAQVLQGRWPMGCVNPHVLPRVPLKRWQRHSMEYGFSQ